MAPDRLSRRASRAMRFAPKLLWAAAGSAYLFTVGWRHPRHRALISTISTHFGYRSSAAERIPARDLRDLVQDDETLRLCEPDVADGNVSLLELLVISKLVRACRPTRLFEIGTFDGRTTLNLAANSADSAEVYTLDLPREGLGRTNLPIEAGERVFIDKPVSGTRYRGSRFGGKVTQLYGDSATFDFSRYEGEMEFVFVDGSHAYDYVIMDSETAVKLLRPSGGLVLWHDYGVWEGVTHGLNRLVAEDRRFSGMTRVSGTSLVLLDTRGRVATRTERVA